MALTLSSPLAAFSVSLSPKDSTKIQLLLACFCYQETASPFLLTHFVASFSFTNHFCQFLCKIPSQSIFVPQSLVRSFVGGSCGLDSNVDLELDEVVLELQELEGAPVGLLAVDE